MKRARAFAGHLILEIILGSGFAAVAFTGIAVQVSNAKQSDTKELAHAQFTHSLAQVIDEVRTRTLGVGTSQRFEGVKVRVELINADDHLYRVVAESKTLSTLKASVEVVRSLPQGGQP